MWQGVAIITENDRESAPGLYKFRGLAELTRRQAVSPGENGEQHDRGLPMRSAA